MGFLPVRLISAGIFHHARRVVLVYPYSEKSVKIFSPPIEGDGFSPMNNKWLQDILCFFLRDIDIKLLMHTLIIFVILIVLLPDSFKHAIGAHNPKFMPNYAIYYVAVFCFSFLFSSITIFTTHSFMEFLVNFARSLKIMSLSVVKKQCLRFCL